MDVTIIVGIKDSSNERPLLLLRFHNEFRIKSKEAKKFYNYVYKKYIKKGFEVRRTGGSSGLTSNPRDDSLFYFLSTYTYSTPRVTVGVMIVQKVNCYEIIYISPYQKKKKLLNAIIHLRY